MKQRIGVIGSGKMGIALGSAFARNGAAVFFGSRDVERVRERLAPRIAAGLGSHCDAVAFADIIVLATRWDETQSIVEEARPFRGKTILSATNAETGGDDLAVGHTTSAAELIAKWAQDANVVEAFVDVYSEFLNEAPNFSAPAPTVLYCGDDARAKLSVAALISLLNFDALDAGPLVNARYIEPMAHLLVYLVRKREFGPLGITHQWIRSAPGLP